MIPGKRFLNFLGAWSVFAFFIALSYLLFPFHYADTHSYFKLSMVRFWQTVGGVFLFIIIWDAWKGREKPIISIKRVIPHNLSLGVWHDVELQFRHNYSFPATIEVFDNYPEMSEVDLFPQTIKLLPSKVTKFNYRIRPTERGNATFKTVNLLVNSPLKFWQMKMDAGESSSVKVFPNFAAVSHFRLLATDHRTSQLGIKLKQRRGEGLEFHQLREYRDSDEIRQIDWKSSARRRKLISKEYQDECDQQIIFMLDCGRRMRSKDDELSHFDHALNAILLLSYVALKQGDAIGLMSFSGEKRWLSPKKNVSSINRVINAVYDLKTSTQAADYCSAARDILKLQRKRSLVIILSNIHDENTGDLSLALSLLKNRHLVLLANLREMLLDKFLDEPVENFSQAIRYTGIFDYLETRKKVKQNFIKKGILCFDTTPKQLPIELVNQYLSIKRSGRL